MTPHPEASAGEPMACPFCGNAGMGTNDAAYVYCFTQGCAMYAREVTPEAWNRRTPAAPVGPSVEPR